MGSKRAVTEKDLKRKDKLKALAAISKPKKITKKKKTLKVVNNEDITIVPEKKGSKLGGKKKRKEETGIEEDIIFASEKKDSKSSGKKKRIAEDVTFAPEKKEGKSGGKKKRKEDSEIEDKSEEVSEEVSRKSKKAKSKKSAKKETKAPILSKSTSKLALERTESAADEVYRISSVDEDCSKGIKKWVTEYHQSRPGLKELQIKIDEFMVSHEKQEDEAKKEREEAAAGDGFTVVKHHKGRKKTTDSESGTAVGSVSQAAVLDKMAKKKNKEVGIDFYRFQRRDAQRNEIMMLQSKFEQDRKQIQQRRAERKFKPF